MDVIRRLPLPFQNNVMKVLTAMSLALAASLAPACMAAPLYSVQFDAKPGTDALNWMASKGFKAQKDAGDADTMALAFSGSALTLEAKSSAFGFLINDGLNLRKAKTIRIVWGVTRYPQGASWKNGVNREPLMVYVFFGTKKLSSDSFFIPNSPYFLGLFLGQDENINATCVGKHFTTGGRYVCLASPKPGETVTSEFNLDQGFRNCFGLSAVPPVTGLSVEQDTSSTSPGTCIAFIKSIQILP